MITRRDDVEGLPLKEPTPIMIAIAMRATRTCPLRLKELGMFMKNIKGSCGNGFQLSEVVSS